MSQRYQPCEREQQYLMPASLREWLPEDHLAWFVVEAVELLDRSAFHAAYRDDGWGRRAYDPAMMVALLLYAYCEGERSSRRIERRCREDVAYRVLSANQQPDQATICRFRQRHEQTLAGLFVDICGSAPRRAWSGQDWWRWTGPSCGPTRAGNATALWPNWRLRSSRCWPRPSEWITRTSGATARRAIADS